eukprot:CAMPEP_0171462768 /NCGR_PEP_ID=MMETSP0945-20130129/6667_1 /TAXON_ID=109269 /ORGANISM="Vaucheria litorea, Strain CCMP2940" /LENGTH=146 /DNA_ID=CAMNT_0011989347 /DNA_START=62 /DNA_END=502 /DNA_ORIENTATION=-
MADAEPQKKKYVHKKYTYRGLTLEDLLDKSATELMELFNCRQRRRLSRGLNIKVRNFIRKLRKAKTNCPFGEKPEVVKTHLRNQIVMPEMVGSVAGVYNGKVFNAVEIKPDMIGHYLGEFSITYKPVRHGRAGVGATNSSRFIPLK